MKRAKKQAKRSIQKKSPPNISTLLKDLRSTRAHLASARRNESQLEKAIRQLRFEGQRLRDEISGLKGNISEIRQANERSMEFVRRDREQAVVAQREAIQKQIHLLTKERDELRVALKEHEKCGQWNSTHEPIASPCALCGNKGVLAQTTERLKYVICQGTACGFRGPLAQTTASALDAWNQIQRKVQSQ